jgi:RNA polymerase sigma-70 factor (ECF subfamily)
VRRSISAERAALCALWSAVQAVRGPQLALAGGPALDPGAPPRTGSSGPGDPAPDRTALRMQALVELAQAGDGEAFGQLYDHYVEPVYRYLYYRLGAHQLAEDLTSETFLRALRRLDSYTWQGKDFGAWLTTIARNLVTDHVKSSRFRLEVTTAEMLDADRAEDGIEDAVVDRLAHAQVIDAVRRLKPDQQECIVLRFLQGLSIAEAADVMGRSQGAIKQLQLRALRALAQLVPETLR